MELCKHELPVDRCGLCNGNARAKSKLPEKKDNTDVVIVAAGIGYPEYLQFSAYVGHPNRPFRGSSRWMAFYADGEIKQEVPEILHVESSVEFNRDEIGHREASSDETHQQIGRLMRTLLDSGKRELKAQLDIVLLSPVDDPRTFRLDAPIKSDKVDHSGKGTAVTAGQYRYTTLLELEKHPVLTSELGL